VRLLNPGAVAAIRKQQGNRRRKTDWLDAAAVCELLARGEGTLVHLDASMAASLRPLWSGRKDLVDTRSRLRQQAGALVDCLWPGFSAADKQAGVSPVLCDLFKTKAGRVIAGLLAEGWTPARFTAAPTTQLQAIFAARGCRLTRPLASRLRARAAGALPAHPAATAGKAAALAGMLGVLDGIDAEVERLEAQMASGWSPRPASSRSWAGPTAGSSGRRCGGRPDWTPHAASPGPKTPGWASAERARPGAGGRCSTWLPRSAGNPGAGGTASARERPRDASRPRWRWWPPATRSGGPALP
jgi:hypothetical protein